MTKNIPKFSAAPSAAGYFYQARLALVLALAKSNQVETVEVAIERLDDISFEANGAPLELLQTKHHIDRTAELTDHSPDIWKTLRVWCVAVDKDPSLPLKTKLILITTGIAPDGSAANLLRPGSAYGDGFRRDPVEAERLLAEVAGTSKNDKLKSAFAVFMGLNQKLRISLLSAVEVLDKQMVIEHLENAIEDQLRRLTTKDKIPTAREYVEGWWWGRICTSLKEDPASPIALAELEAKLDDIREALKRDALVFDYELSEPSDQETSIYDGFPFVRQLQAIGLGGNRIGFAKRDFYRAFNQRSKWSREHAVLDDELANYEQNLCEEWATRFEQMVEANADAEEPVLRQAGSSLYQWVENDARYPLRNVSTKSMCVGSYHILSNRVRVGWHRDFATLFGSGE